MRMNLRSRIAAIVLSLALLSTWLYTGIGVDENRAKSPVPDVTLGTIYNGALFPLVDSALIDRYGPKSAAVSLVGSSILALGFSPSRQVVRGTDGSLFYAGDFWIPCQPSQKLDDIDFSGEVSDYAGELAAGGTTFLYAVVPNKSSVGSDRLGPLRQSLTACSMKNRDYIEAMPTATMFSAWPEFETAYEDGEQLYIPGDTHWDTPGVVLYSKLLLQRLVDDGDAPADMTFDPIADGEPYTFVSDLYRFSGQKLTDTVTPALPQRDAVMTASTSDTVGGAHLLHWSSTGDAPLVPGRTLIVRDSLFDYNASVLAPYFSDLTAVVSQELLTPDDLAALGHFDLVIFQQFERSVPQHFDALKVAGVH